MGDPKKKHKRYVTPERPYDQAALIDELRLIGAYGLRNKRELWRHRTQLSKIRRIAREAQPLDPARRGEVEGRLIRRLQHLGLLKREATIDDVLSLRVEDLLERRLQTIVYRKGLAKSLFQARQLIVHGHISVKGRRVRVPSYWVKADEEDEIDYFPSSPLYARDHPLRVEVASARVMEGVR